ncbi:MULTISPECIES: alpha/beta hydrolase [Cellulomonas]|uniref:alpha/beta hydrolase n=1 Tax=Cellulomonas TaxID=1707 RepID=UPI00069BC683|nr:MULTISPECIES: alpha/beta hydrolase-fold protein [Cellulomonas]
MHVAILDRSWQGWTVVGVAACVTVACAVLLALAVRRRRRRHHPSGLLLATGACACVLLLAVTAGLGVGVGTGYLSDWRSMLTAGEDATTDAPTVLPTGQPAVPPRPTTATTGTEWAVTVPATARGFTQTEAWVYAPPGYSQHPDEHYPVLYTLHGAPGTGSDWFTAGHLDTLLDQLIASGAIPPVLVVSPDLSLGPVDEPVDLPAPGPLRETLLVDDVVPWADQHLRTTPDRADRAIAGMSAGGLGALLVGMRHQSTFAGVVSLMPYLEPESPELHANASALAANSPLEVIGRTTYIAPLPVFLGVPTADPVDDGRRIAAALDQVGVPETEREYPAGHDWAAVTTMTPDALTWLVGQLGWRAPAPG